MTSTLTPLAIVPVKRPADAKRRLASAFPETSLPGLVRAVAERVVSACEGAGAQVVVIAGDDEVADWALDLGVGVIPDPSLDLNAAVAAGIEAALGAGRPWCAVHADLPLITPGDVEAVCDAVSDDTAVLAPSRDGGTNLLASTAMIPLRYGPSSFSRHLAATTHLDRIVIVRTGTAVELDTPADLEGITSHPRGQWIRSYLG